MVKTSYKTLILSLIDWYHNTDKWTVIWACKQSVGISIDIFNGPGYKIEYVTV